MLTIATLGRSPQFGRGQFGQSSLREAEIEQLAVRHGQREATLRAGFFDLSQAILTLKNANKNTSASFTKMLQDFNAAVDAYTISAETFVAARAKVDPATLSSEDLEAFNPNAQKIPVPKFELPTPTSGLFGGATVRAADIQIRYGNQVLPLSGHSVNEFGNQLSWLHNGFGAAQGIVIAIIVGLAVISVVVLIVVALPSDEALVADANARNMEARFKIADAEKEFFAKANDTCIKGGGNGIDCLEKAEKALVTFQEGLPGSDNQPSGFGFLEVLGVLVILGAVAGGGYLIYRRRKNA